MKLKSYILIAMLGLCSTACNEQFLDINTNPNSLPTASSNFVLTSAMRQTSSNFNGPNETGSYWSGLWTQSNGYILSTTTFTYNFTNGDFNYWDGFYDNLQDYQYVINNADADGLKFLKGPAKVMKTLVFQQLVDLYGNIPYSDALKGVASLAPKFDDQKAIYDDLIKALDEAIVDLKANPFSSAYASSDIVFSGNTTKWIRFANSLKMRILMRQARVASKASFITTEVNKIVSEGSGFITGEDVGIGSSTFWQPADGQMNPIYEAWGYSAAGAKKALNNYPRVTKFLVDGLKASKDTIRLKRMCYAIGGEGTTAGVSTKPEIAANYAGVPFGASSGYLPTTVSAIGPSVLVKGAFNRPFIIMTAAEIQLHLAEAKERFGTNLSGSAQAYFDEGIAQSFRALGSTTAAAAAFKTSKIVNYDYAVTTNKLEAIALQKWLASCNFTGLEAWAEYRKTGYPATPQSLGVPDAKRPVRLFYPNTEGGSNTANVTAQGTIDVFGGKLFWDID